MDREVKRLKQSRIPIVKVRWNSRRGPEYTWEREDQMQKKYPHLAKVIENQIRVWDHRPLGLFFFCDIPTVIPPTSVVAPETSTIALLFPLPLLWLRRLLSLHPLDCVAWFPIRVPILIPDGDVFTMNIYHTLQLISPFICTDSSEAPDSFDGPPL
ncbi:hypothetical protein Tco_1156719 [Tanacetum coccineum]